MLKTPIEKHYNYGNFKYISKNNINRHDKFRELNVFFYMGGSMLFYKSGDAQRLNLTESQKFEPKSDTVANGQTEETQKSYEITIAFNNMPCVEFPINMYGFKGISVDVNIWLDWLSKNDLIINLKKKLVTVNDRTLEIESNNHDIQDNDNIQFE